MTMKFLENEVPTDFLEASGTQETEADSVDLGTENAQTIMSNNNE